MTGHKALAAMSLIILMMLPFFASAGEKGGYSPDKNYRILMRDNRQYSIEQTDSSTVKLKRNLTVNDTQLWRITRHKGCLKLINVATGMAMAVRGDAVIMAADNNGDDSQLWSISAPLLIPVKAPKTAVATEPEGTLVLIPGKEAYIDPAAKFVIEVCDNQPSGK